MFTLLACTSTEDTASPADPETVLLELGAEVTTDLFKALHFTVGDTLLWEMAEGETASGSLAFPADADVEHWDTDGEVTVEWAVAHHEDPDIEGLRYWDWTVTTDIATLTLPSAQVSGTSTWTITWESYDYQYGHHAWAGALAIDGASAVDVAFTGVATWSTLNTLEGTIDGAAVTWENESPDEP